MAKETRKPRLNTNSSCIMPFRYVLIKIKSVKRISERDKFGYCEYDVTYTIDKDSYYYEEYGNEVYHMKVVCTPKAKQSFYKVGKVIKEPMTID